jgi:hypothetical protein
LATGSLHPYPCFLRRPSPAAGHRQRRPHERRPGLEQSACCWSLLATAGSYQPRAATELLLCRETQVRLPAPTGGPTVAALHSAAAAGDVERVAGMLVVGVRVESAAAGSAGLDDGPDSWQQQEEEAK